MLLLIFLHFLINYTLQSIPEFQINNKNSTYENDPLFYNREQKENYDYEDFDDFDDFDPREEDRKYYETIKKKYEDLLISEKKLEDKYKSLIEEYKNNAVKIGINQVYFKALSIVSIILTCLLFLIILIKIYRICFSNNLNSVFIENLKQKLTYKKGENLQLSGSSENFNSKIIQNNINFSCYNLLNKSNLSLSDTEKSSLHNSYEKNYDAPIIASCITFNDNEQKNNSKENYNNNELQSLTTKPQ